MRTWTTDDWDLAHAPLNAQHRIGALDAFKPEEASLPLSAVPDYSGRLAFAGRLALCVVSLVVAVAGCRDRQGDPPQPTRMTTGKPESLSSDAAPEPSPRLLRQIAAARPQGKVPIASLREALVLITIDPWKMSGECLALMAEDVLQKAGYSASSFSPDSAAGIPLAASSTTLEGKTTLVLEGQLVENGFNTGHNLYFARLINGERNPTRGEVEDLLAEVLASRKVRHYLSSNPMLGADQVGFLRVDPRRLAETCGANDR